MSQRKLAEAAGIGRVTLAQLEAGRGTVAALGKVLSVLGYRFSGQPPGGDLGPWIAARRANLGLSQEHLSTQASVSKPAIINVEHGKGRIETLTALMTAIAVPVRLEPVEPPSDARSPRPHTNVTIHVGDCREHMAAMAEQAMLVDSIVTDPPYHLATITKRFGSGSAARLQGGEPGASNPYRSIANGFMGKEWDGGGVAFETATWRAAFEVLKPGGYLVAFGGPRTFHRLVVAVEDAGFEIRDTIMWVFGSGFPKSRNVGREVEALLRKSPSVSLSLGAAGLPQWQGYGTALKPAYEPILIARKPIAERSVAANLLRFGTGSLNIDRCRVPVTGHDGIGDSGRLGRWPANLIHDGSPAVLTGFPSTQKSRGGGGRKVSGKNVYGSHIRHFDAIGFGDAGSAARFFYAAKASQQDRGPDNTHPTVKPNDLMRYLVRLVTPPGGTVFDPFLGSGSTGVAAVQEGFGIIGCEMVGEYVEIAHRRILGALDGHSREAA